MTSPAAETEQPAKSRFSSPLMRNPVVPFRVERLRLVPNPPVFPNTTYAAPEFRAVASAYRAPTMKSSMPSPLTSPASETE